MSAKALFIILTLAVGGYIVSLLVRGYRGKK
jgi:hypothetical protein